MPELPEVHTTVMGLRPVIVGRTIKSVWSDFHIGTSHGHKQNLKNRNYLKEFKKIVVGARIVSVERKGKNILINLNNKYTIIVHMKMTGHLMTGAYDKFIHFRATLSHGKELCLSDMRKFASVCVEETDELDMHEGLNVLGTDALQIGIKEFIEKIQTRRDTPIKSVLLDQKVVAGIGNIYSDEILWASLVHPLSRSGGIPQRVLQTMYKHSQRILRQSIRLGGDSMSDYRNVEGKKGGFQKLHKAYRQTGKKCQRRGCGGIIRRMMVRGRSAHFCSKHQKMYA